MFSFEIVSEIFLRLTEVSGCFTRRETMAILVFMTVEFCSFSSSLHEAVFVIDKEFPSFFFFLQFIQIAPPILAFNKRREIRDRGASCCVTPFRILWTVCCSFCLTMLGKKILSICKSSKSLLCTFYPSLSQLLQKNQIELCESTTTSWTSELNSWAEYLTEPPEAIKPSSQEIESTRSSANVCVNLRESYPRVLSMRTVSTFCKCPDLKTDKLMHWFHGVRSPTTRMTRASLL